MSRLTAAQWTLKVALENQAQLKRIEERLDMLLNRIPPPPSKIPSGKELWERYTGTGRPVDRQKE